MWGGRFSTGPDAIMEAINASIEFDKRLGPQDIESSIAHVDMLGATGILNVSDVSAIKEGLEDLRRRTLNQQSHFAYLNGECSKEMDTLINFVLGPGSKNTTSTIL